MWARHRTLIFLNCAAACAIFLVLYFQITSPWPNEVEAPISYAGENIQWTRCGDIGDRPLECSNITVPMDQFDTTQSNIRTRSNVLHGNKTFTIPLIRLRGKNATQNLLLNPGGPGGSGIAFLHTRGEQLQAIVGEGYHLLSFDPRGINSSLPRALCYPDDDTRRKLSNVRSERIVEDGPDLYAWTHNYVHACQDTTGEHGKYINTPQTAADMNSILDAVGQEDMAYWGFSYGTLLGQTYAGMYPERAKRMIIDGVVNQFDWYEGRFDIESLADAENVLAGFYDECIKAGPKNCTLAALADTKEELSDLVYSHMAKILEEPVSVYVNNTSWGSLTHEKIWYDVIFRALYKPAAWYETANNLAQLIHGNGTALFKQLDGGDVTSQQFMEANAFVSANDGLSGKEHWPQDRHSLVDELLPLLNESSFFAGELKSIHVKQKWRYPRTHKYKPVKGVKTAGPLLLLSTTYDPVCPLISARSANEAFEGSQIVEVEGYGHCSLAVTSICAADIVREFLYEGKIPDGYTKCKVDSPYFVKPGEDTKTLAKERFSDPDSQRIHAAQLELAKDWEQPARFRLR